MLELVKVYVRQREITLGRINGEPNQVELELSSPGVLMILEHKNIQFQPLMTPSFLALIGTHLDKLNIDHDEDLLSYIESVIIDPLNTIEENKDAVHDIISGRVEEDELPEQTLRDAINLLFDEVNRALAEITSRSFEATQLKEPPAALREIFSVQKSAPLKTADEIAEDTFWTDTTAEKEDIQEKRRVVEKYGIAFIDTVEFGEDGRVRTGLQEAGISAKFAAKISADSDAAEDIWTNDNNRRVAAAEATKRQILKSAHEKEQDSIRLQKEKEKQKQEKEKKRVAKKERRSGR